jgi:ankyrin repeat protein
MKEQPVSQSETVNGRSLFKAIELGLYDEVEQILKQMQQQKIDPNIGDVMQHGFTPMHMAVTYEHPHLINLLVKYGVKIDSHCSEAGCTPLHLAVLVNNNRETIELLLDHGADVESLTKQNYSPLRLALNKNCCYKNIMVILEALFKRYRTDDINSIESIGEKDLLLLNNATHAAAAEDNFEFVKFMHDSHFIQPDLLFSAVFGMSELQLTALINFSFSVYKLIGKNPKGKYQLEEYSAMAEGQQIGLLHLLGMQLPGWKLFEFPAKVIAAKIKLDDLEAIKEVMNDLPKHAKSHPCYLFFAMNLTTKCQYINKIVIGGVNLTFDENGNLVNFEKKLDNFRQLLKLLLAETNSTQELLNANNHVDVSGRTPLSYFVDKPLPIVQILLESGANVRSQDIIRAIKHGDPAVVSLLATKCKDLNILDKSGKTLLDYLYQSERDELLDVKYDLIEQFRSLGAKDAGEKIMTPQYAYKKLKTNEEPKQPKGGHGDPSLGNSGGLAKSKMRSLM